MSRRGRISDVFFATAERFEDRPFLHAPFETAALYDLEKNDYTYGEAVAQVETLRRAYQFIGVGEGHRIALAMENRPEFFLHFLALNALGASILPLNVAMQTEEVRYQIDHSACDLIVAAPPFIGALHAIAEDAARRPKVIGPGEISKARLPSSASPSAKSDAEREAAILYTSGTTGTPRGCILSNDYFIAIGEHYTQLGGLITFEAGCERIITPLPVTHMNALACSFMAAIKTGSCLIQLDRFHPRIWWKSVRESDATIMHYLGVMPAMLLSAPPTGDEGFGGRIRFAFGAGCDPRHHATFEARFGVLLIEAWAMTETGAGAWITASDEPRHVGTRCFGRAPEGLQWKLVDEEGNDVAKGAPGELLVRRAGENPRAHFFSGYFNDADATEEAWRGGWFHTGDAVRVDKEGNFYFVDRLKNVIRRSGENIAAIEVESLLMRHERVRICVVAPVPDDIRGEEVMALVVPSGKPGDENTASAIFDFAMENLAYFKAPAYIAFVDAIPMTPSEKVRRGETKALASKLYEKGECFSFASNKRARKG